MCYYKKWKAVNINVYKIQFIYISRLSRPRVSLLSERGQLSWEAGHVSVEKQMEEAPAEQSFLHTQLGSMNAEIIVQGTFEAVTFS